jgi:hypothetical protein
MSTELEKIKTKDNKEIQLTRFYGGDKQGVCVQITTINSLNYNYFQLNVKQIKKLIRILQEKIVDYVEKEVTEDFM